MSENDKIPKKRGRKPKKKINEIKNIKKELNSEEEPLITHLSINLQDVLNETEIDNLTVDDKVETVDSTVESESIFIKPEHDLMNNTKDKYIEEINETENIEKEILRLKYKIFKLNRKANIEVNKVKFKNGTKCWWCKHNFDNPSVGLPELYFGDKFYCIGNFCSFNCALSYNIDCNDNVWKKTSLLNLLYYKTYGLNEKIICAPDWRQLKDFGGNLSISKFRSNSLVNNSEYTLLHPPLETRMHTFEKNLKVFKNNTSNSIYQKLLDESGELVLKRSKPLKSNQYSLDKTLFIKKKKS